MITYFAYGGERMKRYLIYWEDKNNNLDGNVIVGLNPNEIILKDLINHIIEESNKLSKVEGTNIIINNLVIKFMVELK